MCCSGAVDHAAMAGTGRSGRVRLPRGIVRIVGGRLHLIETEGREGNGERRRREGGFVDSTVAEVLLLTDGDDVMGGNEKVRRFARAVDDVCNIITATRHAGKERVDGNTVKGLEKRETVVKEVDHVATVLLVTHENGVIGEIQRFQGLRITGRGRRNGEREDVLERVVGDFVMRERQNAQVAQLIKILVSESALQQQTRGNMQMELLSKTNSTSW